MNSKIVVLCPQLRVVELKKSFFNLYCCKKTGKIKLITVSNNLEKFNSSVELITFSSDLLINLVEELNIYYDFSFDKRNFKE